MFYAPLEDKYIVEGMAFELGDVQYPANWLNLSTPEEKAELGLEEVITVGSPKSDKYYWVSETLEGATLTITNTPKDLDQCKALAVSGINAIAYSLLLPSDWMVVKASETGTPVAPEWTTYRGEVRFTANESRADVEDCADVDELAALVITWPISPDAPITEAPIEPVP